MRRTVAALILEGKGGGFQGICPAQLEKEARKTMATDYFDELSGFRSEQGA
jgi:hypothetical protein